jgi:hypothetical protein
MMRHFKGRDLRQIKGTHALRHEDFWKLEGHKEQSRRQPVEAPTALLSSPPHMPPTRLGGRVGAAERTDARLVKRVVLLRLFYGSEMQKCDVARLQHQPLFFSP